MSQIHEALSKVKQEREKQEGPLGRDASPGIHYAVISVLLLFVAISSVWINIKTLAELENSRGIAQTVARHLDDQKKELLAMSRYWQEDAREKEARLAGLKQEVREIKIAIVQIEDLKINNRLLLNKFIALNDQIRKIEEERREKEEGK
jgi:hypothetical protein